MLGVLFLALLQRDLALHLDTGAVFCNHRATVQDRDLSHVWDLKENPTNVVGQNIFNKNANYNKFKFTILISLTFFYHKETNLTKICINSKMDSTT